MNDCGEEMDDGTPEPGAPGLPGAYAEEEAGVS